MRRYPYSFILLCGLGVAAAIPGLLAVSGHGAWLPPVLADSGAGIALLVTAVALIGSGLFPLVISRLIAADAARKTAADS